MRLVVIIASIGRSAVLTAMLQHLSKQTRKPDLVVLSLVDEADGPTNVPVNLPLDVLYCRKGLAAQRNAALKKVLPDADVITFFDDDFLPAANYLERLEDILANRDFAVVHGNVVADGISGAGLTFEDGFAALDAARDEAADDAARIEHHTSAYGCNMSFRTCFIDPDQEFDERLVLYGWQEDRDFSYRIGRKGKVVRVSNLVGVHLGVKGGRVNGMRLGYSQVVNPLYLMTKGTMPAYAVANLMLRNIIANSLKSFWPEPWVDRRGRLRGNWLALTHVFKGRIDPEHVLKL